MLELQHLGRIIVRRLDEICLYPGDVLARVDQERLDTIRGEPAVLVHLVAASFADSFNAALERDAMRAAQQLEGLFVPEIDATLKAYGQRAARDFFQEHAHLLAHAEDFVDEVDVIDAAGQELINFGQYLIQVALAKLIAEQRLVTEC